MAKILYAPNRFVLGAGELSRLGEYAKNYGKKALILISESGKKRVSSKLDRGFEAAGIETVYDFFNGECSKGEVNRLVDVSKANGCDMVIGVGGGKILDTAKATAYYTETPVLICPTIASTDAPCSALSVLYTDEGVFDSYLFLKSSPDMVLMDTDVIVDSPIRLTVAGMGDALATYFEARACKASDATTCASGKATLAAMALAKLCYETLLKNGVQAKLALEAGVCTEPVERIIEANTLLSGIGFESGGLAGAHAIHNGFTALPETHAVYHGEKVAFGTLTQLVLEGAAKDELADVYEFCQSVGLPTTLAQLGITDVTEEKIRAVAELASVESESIHNMPFTVTADKVYAAIMAADAIGRAYSCDD